MALGYIDTSDNKGVKHFVLHPLWKVSQGCTVSPELHTWTAFSTICRAGYKKDSAQPAAFRRTKGIPFFLTAPETQIKGRGILHMEEHHFFIFCNPWLQTEVKCTCVNRTVRSWSGSHSEVNVLYFEPLIKLPVWRRGGWKFHQEKAETQIKVEEQTWQIPEALFAPEQSKAEEWKTQRKQDTKDWCLPQTKAALEWLLHRTALSTPELRIRLEWLWGLLTEL